MEIITPPDIPLLVDTTDFPYACKEARIAVENGEMIGFALLGLNEHHPHNDYILIGVSPPHRRCGVGSALLRTLISLSKKDLQVGLYDTNIEGIAFAEKWGFIRKRSSYCFALSSEEIPKVESTLGLCRLAEARSLEWKNIFTEVYRNYVDTHEKINPLRKDKPWEEALQELVRGVSSVYSYYQYENGKLAYCIVSTSENTAFLYYCGGTMEDTAKLVFFSKVLSRLAKEFEVLDFELDDVDPSAMLLYSLLPKRDYPAYYTYIRPLQKEMDSV